MEELCTRALHHPASPFNHPSITLHHPSSPFIRAHVQSSMKGEVMEDPLRFINADAAYPRTLLDQRAAGKKLVLVTNSDWVYTSTMMTAAYDVFLPEGVTWCDLFELVIVSACKPDFFDKTARRPSYEIATSDGMLRESFKCAWALPLPLRDFTLQSFPSSRVCSRRGLHAPPHSLKHVSTCSTCTRTCTCTCTCTCIGSSKHREVEAL